MDEAGGSSSSSSAAGGTTRQELQQQHNDQATPNSMRSHLNSDPSLKEKNNEQDSTTSSFKEFDSEIQRMSQDADKIIDSFRREAAVDERSRSRGGRNSSADDGDEPMGFSPSPITPRASIRSTSDYGDDSMNDEWDRLEEATAAVRESLDKSDHMTESQLKSMLLSPDGDDNSAVLSTTTTTPPFTPPSSLNIDTNNNPPSSGMSSSSRSKKKKKNEQTPSPLPSLASTLASSNQTQNQQLLEDVSERSTFSELTGMGNQEALMLAITVVWAAVVVALVQARYCLLDEDGFLFTSNNNN